VIRRRDFLRAGAVPFLASRGRPVRSCILLKLTGGPSQLDTWDMKPDAPSGIRGPFKSIRTNVPGIRISEIFPRMARHADKYSLIRSVHHTDKTHGAAEQIVFFTGLDAHKLPADSFGRNCLRARQLVEAGARFVTVNMFESVFDGVTWDVHGWKPFSPISCYRDFVGPMFDSAYSALLEDLSRSGLLESTLVVAMGEFGRTPKINPDGGRDHWPHCFTVLMAGGGIAGGQVYGSSDRLGAEPRDNPVTPAMIAATIRSALEAI
jgi:hypothetical protein